MNWHPLAQSRDFSATLNKRIGTHLKLRSDVEAGTARIAQPLNDRTDEPRNESLRREIFIRMDIIEHLHQSGKPTHEHAEILKAINAELDDVGGHYRPTNAVNAFRS